jgi:hypothetical protein
MDLIVNSGSGATSCISVRLHDACRFYKKNGFWPDSIDSSAQFDFFKLNNDQDLSDLVFGPYYKPFDSDYINFDHGWQFAWYNELQIKKIKNLSLKVCCISDEINNKALSYFQQYRDRSGVLYRGNDKALEVAPVDYNTMLDMGVASGGQKWLIQTDEVEFYHFWKTHFPDSVRIESIPMINKDHSKYVMPENRSAFLVDFIAALIVLSQLDKLLITTGNTGLWACIFRGTTNNVYQAWGGNECFRIHNS